MCFSSKMLKYQKDFFKLYNDKKLKDNLSKAQKYLESNKELISRNYEKLRGFKKNSFQKEINKNNNLIGILFQKHPKLLNKTHLNHSNNKNSSINNYSNSKENKLISSYSFISNSQTPNDNTKKNKNNSIFTNTNIINKKMKSKNITNDSTNKNKINNSISLLNIKNINDINNKIGKTKFYAELNKIFNKNKKNIGVTRNNINKINFMKKITKYPLSPNISKIKNANLNMTSRQKTKPFSRSPSMSSSLSNNNINLSDKFEINENTNNIISKNRNNNSKKKNVNKYADNNLFKNKLKKVSIDNIYKDNSKSKEKKNDSMSLFDKLYEKIALKSFKEIKPLVFMMKSKRASSYSNINYIRYDKNYNYKNKIKKALINSNDMLTSGSINCCIQNELSSEEIHFKAVKFYQDIKKDSEILD